MLLYSPLLQKSIVFARHNATPLPLCLLYIDTLKGVNSFKKINYFMPGSSCRVSPNRTSPIPSYSTYFALKRDKYTARYIKNSISVINNELIVCVIKIIPITRFSISAIKLNSNKLKAQRF